MRMSRRMTMGGGPKKYRISAYENMAANRKKGVGANFQGRANFIGGRNESGIMIATGDSYTSAGVRSAISMSYARDELSGSVDGNGSLILGGGASSQKVERITSAGVLSTLADMLGGGQSGAAATNGVGAVLFAGGTVSAANNKINKYLNGVLSSMPTLSAARWGLSGVKNGAGSVLFAGGMDTVNLGTVDCITTADVRSTLTALQTNRRGMASAADGLGNVLFINGSLDSGTSYAVDMYTPANIRSSYVNAGNARYGHQALKCPNGDVVIGGGNTNIIEFYTTAGVKSVLNGLSSARPYLMAATDIDGNMVFAGGEVSGVASAYVDKLSFK